MHNKPKDFGGRAPLEPAGELNPVAEFMGMAPGRGREERERKGGEGREGKERDNRLLQTDRRKRQL